GYYITYENNKLKNFATVKQLKRFPKTAYANLKKYIDVVRDFRPDLLICDLEPFSALIAKLFNIPIITVDYPHIVSKCRYNIPKNLKRSYNKNKIVLRFLGIKADYYLIPTFFFPVVKNKNVFLEPIPLREKVIKSKPINGDFIFVYQTSTTNQNLLDVLKKSTEKFIIYGFDKEENDNNLSFRKFNEDLFYDELSSCKAVITNGGMGLISEAISLKKPVLSEPIIGQFEQEIAAHYVQKYRYGNRVKKMSKKGLENFLLNIKIYRKTLDSLENWDNSPFFDRLDNLIYRSQKKMRKYKKKDLVSYIFLNQK
ncbi:MAG: teichoic acid biosynthesis protein, partial [Nanoarchaeota archaeon]|nr:teichoic acid biosynthesis protein [Nanoarchaeota archaeon]